MTYQGGGRTYKVIGKCPICRRPYMKKAALVKHIRSHSEKVAAK